MKTEEQKLTNGNKYFRCPHCGSLTSENFVKENGKIECRQVVLRGNRYVFCDMHYYVADYNAFVYDEEHKCFKKFISAKHWW
jgi:transcription elongation factor Elf1